MATLLFYQKPVQLNSDVHLNTRLGSLAGDFSFSRETNSIPLAAVEFFDTAREYPIAFTGKEGGAMFPIALLGVRQDENLFVSAEGKWEGRYIPAFVRRHGLPGFSPTQGHIPSAIPYLPHAIAGLTSGTLRRVQLIAKGSLFLGRMTEMTDGASFLLERNAG